MPIVYGWQTRGDGWVANIQAPARSGTSNAVRCLHTALGPPRGSRCKWVIGPKLCKVQDATMGRCFLAIQILEWSTSSYGQGASPIRLDCTIEQGRSVQEARLMIITVRSARGPYAFLDRS